ncbi:MAG TPA: hypothetical protein VM580_14490 [Labilithrix sp.]|nr:hypothetical protein [Labilithrix sp.]
MMAPDMRSLALRRVHGPAATLAALSRAWAGVPAADATLTVGVPSDEAVVLGAFQRESELSASEARAPVVRRGSGGGWAWVGPGSVWLQLALARADALVSCTPDKLLNRYVRPLLRAATGLLSVPVSYFGRDWVSAAQRPVALVAFAHDSGTNQALFEAIVAVRTPFASAGRPSFLGKTPATLEELAGRSLDPESVATRFVDGYRSLAASVLDAGTTFPVGEEVAPSAVAWEAVREEAIGLIGAGRDESGRLRVGGELMASQDAILRLE